MTDQVQDAQGNDPQRRGHRRRRWLTGAAAVSALALAVLWQARSPIADRFIQDSLAEKGIKARYDITRIGPRTQRLENVVIGDPAQPDLVAKVIEIDLGIAGFAPVLRAIRADGVTVRAALRNGTVSLGSLDKLRDGGAGDGALPDIDLALKNGRLMLGTDFGRVDVRGAGAGNLRSGFKGALIVAAGRLAGQGCAISGADASLAMTTANGRIRLAGPLKTPSIDCPAQRLAVREAEMHTDLRFDPREGGWQMRGRAASQTMQLSGLALSAPSALIDFNGAGGKTNGQIRLDGATLAGVGIGGRSPRLDARLDGGGGISFAARLNDVRSNAVAQALARRDSLAATPLGPLATSIAGAVDRLQRANRLTVQGAWSDGQLLVRQATLSGASGGLVALSAGSALKLGGRGDWQLDGALVASGDGLPDARLRAARREDGGMTARLTIADYRASTARFSATPLLIERAPDGAMSIRTDVNLDGPLPDGAVRGLMLPLDIRVSPNGRASLAGSCLPVRWSALQTGTLSLDPAQISLCDALDAPFVRQTTLTGQIGTSPLRLTLGHARFEIGRRNFTLTDVNAEIGAVDAPVRFAATSLTGQFGGHGINGSLSGGHGRIGTVPLDLSEVAGKWRFENGALVLDGRLRVADIEPERRFVPLDVPDARFVLADGQIDASGTLTHPSRARPIADVTIRHDLSSGAGDAALAVNKLRFDAGLQPDDLTPLALGVVANVAGTVAGEGAIRWTRDGVTSTGSFGTQGMNLAAAFGPITNLSTKINFTNLLGLVTEPGQLITLGSVSPGVDVRDGAIRFALLADRQARIESGRWPFAGGTLELLPTTVDLTSRSARRMAVRVTGLDAGAFINELALEDISATGTYDGLLPMVFDEQGGRIEGGILVARQQGLPPLVVRDAASLTVPCDPTRQAGNLAYVGVVSNAQLGTMGRLAFDALKNLRYKCLTILLDGALDGEFVTRLAINGVNQGSQEASKSIVTRAFLGLPFIFNIRIEAPFRGLINTARSFSDPSDLIRDCLKPQFNTALASGSCNGGVAVQPADSDKGLEKDRK